MAGKYSFLSLFPLLSLLTHISSTLAFPSYGSLGGLSGRELDELVARLPQVLPPSPPGPLQFNGTKLVNDADHPWKPLRQGDIRGPCPGLNTLASHGVSLHPFLSNSFQSRGGHIIFGPAIRARPTSISPTNLRLKPSRKTRPHFVPALTFLVSKVLTA